MNVQREQLIAKLRDLHQTGQASSVWGVAVREAWIANRLRLQALGKDVPPHHLVPYDDPSFPPVERQADDEIGVAIVQLFARLLIGAIRESDISEQLLRTSLQFKTEAGFGMAMGAKQEALDLEQLIREMAGLKN